MPSYSIPGVYVEEIAKFPPSVAQVPTAIPAFMGRTEKTTDAQGGSLINKAIRIASQKEYEQIFGIGPRPTVTRIDLDADNNFVNATLTVPHYLYDAIRLFYANGGGDCYIISVGGYTGSVTDTSYTGPGNALEVISKIDEPTILLFPDAANLTAPQLGNVQKAALLQCGLLKDRVTVCDTLANDSLGTNFRTNIGINDLKYGMAYTPWLSVALPKNVAFRDVQGNIVFKPGAAGGVSIASLASATVTTDIITPYVAALNDLSREQPLLDTFGIYKSIIAGINGMPVSMPPSGAVAGVYAYVDRTRGVWKAPANVSLNGVIGPVTTFLQSQLEALNIDVTAGKSINAIRAFTGKGTLIWGARTLAGNDNEWRYVPVRRFYNMVEESVKKACEQFVFEPNDANTWVRVQAMIENFLLLQWRDGALQGVKPEHAFFVSVGLGKTMTALDILEGRMIVEIGMAPVRPAEFIILRFSQKMAES
jgi:uncharacterized protein